MHHDDGDNVIHIRALLTRARQQGGIDPASSLIVASDALRQGGLAPRAPLDRLDCQLAHWLEDRRQGHVSVLPPGAIAALAELAEGGRS